MSDLARNANLFEQLRQESTRLSPELAAWIHTAHQRWREGVPLDHAFGLKPGPGQRNPATLARLAERNRHLLMAWVLVAGGTDWAKAENLACTIKRLTPLYRRYRSGHTPPTALTHMLCKASDYGPLPEKPRQLWNICRQVDIIVST